VIGQIVDFFGKAVPGKAGIPMVEVPGSWMASKPSVLNWVSDAPPPDVGKADP
jgi:hypothetical protein